RVSLRPCGSSDGSPARALRLTRCGPRRHEDRVEELRAVGVLGRVLAFRIQLIMLTGKTPKLRKKRKPMSTLATAIYTILRRLVPNATITVTYEYLVAELGHMAPPNQDLRPRDRRMDFALGE